MCVCVCVCVCVFVWACVHVHVHACACVCVCLSETKSCVMLRLLQCYKALRTSWDLQVRISGSSSHSMTHRCRCHFSDEQLWPPVLSIPNAPKHLSSSFPPRFRAFEVGSFLKAVEYSRSSTLSSTVFWARGVCLKGCRDGEETHTYTHLKVAYRTQASHSWLYSGCENIAYVLDCLSVFISTVETQAIGLHTRILGWIFSSVWFAWCVAGLPMRGGNI